MPLYLPNRTQSYINGPDVTGPNPKSLRAFPSVSSASGPDVHTSWCWLPPTPRWLWGISETCGPGWCCWFEVCSVVVPC